MNPNRATLTRQIGGLFARFPRQGGVLRTRVAEDGLFRTLFALFSKSTNGCVTLKVDHSYGAGVPIRIQLMWHPSGAIITEICWHELFRKLISVKMQPFPSHCIYKSVEATRSAHPDDCDEHH